MAVVGTNRFVNLQTSAVTSARTCVGFTGTGTLQEATIEVSFAISATYWFENGFAETVVSTNTGGNHWLVRAL